MRGIRVLSLEFGSSSLNTSLKLRILKKALKIEKFGIIEKKFQNLSHRVNVDLNAARLITGGGKKCVDKLLHPAFHFHLVGISLQF